MEPVSVTREVIAAPLPGLDLRQHYGHHQSPAVRAGGLIFWPARILVPIANLARLIVFAKPVAGGVRVLLTGRR